MRRCCVAVFFLALLLLTFMTACGGGGSAPIAVTIAQPSSTSIPAGSSGVTLTANVAHDSKNGGVSWSLTPASGCGALSNASTTSATYTPPANTITADCTATITATSVNDTTKTMTLVLTMRAITVSVASSAGSTTTFGSGAPAVTLTATLNNEATGSTDSVTWNLVASGSQTGVARRSTRSAHPAITSETCGTLVPSESNPLVAIYTPPTAVSGTNCTATITATSKANGNLSTKAYTVNAIVLAITSPTSFIQEYADQGPISFTSTITNDGANTGVLWTMTSVGQSCGTLAQSGTSATYTPPADLSAPCGAQVTLTSVTDPSKALAAPAIQIIPNIAITFNPAAPSALNEGATQALTVSITNDLSHGGVNWSLTPATCGSLSGATSSAVTYTAGPTLAANCAAAIKATAVGDSLQSASASIAVTATGVSITSPTSAQQVANSSVTGLAAAITADGSGKGISWSISPATCGALSATTGTSINYTAPSEANLPAACTATITASSTYDSTKTSTPVTITANPIAMSAITSTGVSFPATVGQGSPALALTATVSYDPAHTIGWNIVPNDNSCGSLGAGVANGNSSTAPFVPPATVATKCTATISAIDAADTSKLSSVQISVVPLTVTITTPATSPVSVNEGSTQPLVATVLGDVSATPSVTWALNSNTCGALSTTAAVSSGTPVIFTAPAPTVAACSVTATATSVSDPTKTANVTLNVVPPAISVGFINPGPWNMDASNSNGNSTIQVVASVTNDIGNQGVTWQYSGTPCATLAPSGTGNLTLGLTAVQDSTLNTGTNCTMTVTATSVADTSKNAQTTLTVTPISVTITPGGSQSYAQGASNTIFNAVANNDALGYPATGSSGVTWSLSNSDGCGTLTNNTTTSVTYVVPTSVSSTCQTQLVATSVADGTKSNFDTISVYPPGPALTIDPTQGGQKTDYYGVQGQGFQLSLNVNGGTPPYTFTTATGSIPPGMSYSSSSAQYAANSLVGAPTSSAAYTFTVKVTDAANNTATSPSVTLNVNAGPNHQHDSYLNGRYVCLTKGYEDATSTTSAFPWTALASVPMTGTSSFTGGISDLVTGGGNYPGILASTTETGTVNIGSDNHGIMTLTTSGSSTSLTTTWAVMLNNLAGPTATEVHGIEIDDVGTSASTQHGEFTCYQATTSAFTSSNINGHSFAFGFGGVTNSGNQKTSVGVVSFSSGGAVTGVADTLKFDGTESNTTISGSTASGPDATSGRMKVTLGKSGTITDDLIVYLIDANRAVGVLVGDPSAGLDGMQSGNMRKQKQTTFSNANLTGPFVMYNHSTEYSGGVVIDYNSNLIQGTGDGSTGVTLNVNYQDQANVTSSGNSSGSLTGGVLTTPMTVPMTVESNGRAVYQPTGNTAFTSLYFYLYDTNSAFVMDGTEGLGVGWVEPQTATTSTSPAGNYIMFDMPASNPNADDQQNLLNLSGGTITGVSDSANRAWFEWDQPINQGSGSLTYSGPTTYGLVAIGDSGSVANCIMITATKTACISADDEPNISILVQ